MKNSNINHHSEIRLYGEQLREVLTEEVNQKINNVILHLSSYNGSDLFRKWTIFIQQIDEYINLKYALPEDEWKLLSGCLLSECTMPKSKSFNHIINLLSGRFSRDVVKRFIQTTIMCSSISIAFVSMGFYQNALSTIDDIANFLQSRRLYYVSYLSLIPVFARGSKTISQCDILNVFQYYIEFNMASITTGCHYIIAR